MSLARVVWTDSLLFIGALTIMDSLTGLGAVEYMGSLNCFVRIKIMGSFTVHGAILIYVTRSHMTMPSR
jgi:hypothetical protein